MCVCLNIAGAAFLLCLDEGTLRCVNRKVQWNDTIKNGSLTDGDLIEG